jgi:hypothetical protein
MIRDDLRIVLLIWTRWSDGRFLLQPSIQFTVIIIRGGWGILNGDPSGRLRKGCDDVTKHKQSLLGWYIGRYWPLPLASCDSLPLASCDSGIYVRKFGVGRGVIMSTLRKSWTGNADPCVLILVPEIVDVSLERFELDAWPTMRACDHSIPLPARTLLGVRHDIATFLECE